MFITVSVAFISLIILVSLHELGHFLTAKKFGVKVEEFGLGYPPRIFGKKFGDTLYSLNLLPFGAFVRIPEDASNNPSSAFSAKPLWQRFLIIFNGAASFWLVALILFSFVYLLGAPTIVEDSDQGLLDLKVQISQVLPQSPASQAGLKIGDVVSVARLKSGGAIVRIDKVAKIQEFVKQAAGQEIVLIVRRGSQSFDVSLVPRVSPPAGQGPLGVALVRTGLKSYPIWEAPLLGLRSTIEMTWAVVSVFGDSLVRLFQRSPTGLQLVGPIGIVNLLSQGLGLGAAYFLQMIGLLSVNVAVLNLLPIPAFDGGKLLFLAVEAMRKKPASREFEGKITAVFFGLLIFLMIFVTFRDIKNIF